MAILDLIEWDNPGPNEMVHRVPEWGSGEFRLGSQLVVREFQTAELHEIAWVEFLKRRRIWARRTGSRVERATFPYPGIADPHE